MRYRTSFFEIDAAGAGGFLCEAMGEAESFIKQEGRYEEEKL